MDTIVLCVGWGTPESTLVEIRTTTPLILAVQVPIDEARISRLEPWESVNIRLSPSDIGACRIAGFFSLPSDYWYMDRGGTGRVPAGTTVVRKAVRSARLQVRPDGTLRVVAPPSFDVAGFLQRNTAWIEERREEFDRLAAEGCGREEMLLLHGRFYHLIPGTRFVVDDTRGTITCPPGTALRRSLTRMLREEVADHLKTCTDPAGWRPKIAVKLQRTRWGSCSTLGNININLRVIALPGSLREYVVVHEAAHLLEPNHSKRFWHLVGGRYPGYREAEAELRRYWVILERNRVWGSIRDAT